MGRQPHFSACSSFFSSLRLLNRKWQTQQFWCWRKLPFFFHSIFLLGIFLKLYFLYPYEKNAKHKPSESYFLSHFCHLCCSHLLHFQFVFLKCHVPNWIQSVLLLKLEHCWTEQKDYCTGLTHTVTVNVIKCSICPFSV